MRDLNITRTPAPDVNEPVCPTDRMMGDYNPMSRPDGIWDFDTLINYRDGHIRHNRTVLH